MVSLKLATPSYPDGGTSLPLRGWYRGHLRANVNKAFNADAPKLIPITFGLDKSDFTPTRGFCEAWSSGRASVMLVFEGSNSGESSEEACLIADLNAS